MKRYYTALVLLMLAACSKNAPTPGVLDGSGTGKLGRYDLGISDYDPRPITTFVLSYDSANRVTDVFEKEGQTLISYPAHCSPQTSVRQGAASVEELAGDYLGVTAAPGRVVTIAVSC